MIQHQPVLLNEVLEYMPDKCGLVVDGTLGHGGHTQAMLEYFAEQKQFTNIIGLDVDEKILEKAKTRLKGYSDSLVFEHASYADIDLILQKNGYKTVDFMLIDIGVNLEHFKDGGRGFSIKVDAPLDMRFDTGSDVSGHTIINTYSAEKLQSLFEIYADFASKQAGELAKHIVKIRKHKNISTTFDLKTALKQMGLGEKACAVIFQAIRIETNQEIRNLKLFLEKIPVLLSVGGRCGVMSYHSGEDRLVKQAFKSYVETDQFALVSKKAIQPTWQEKEKNKASRSAKYRIIERLK